MKTIKYDDIKTAKTVDEFRENLKKYFLTVSHKAKTNDNEFHTSLVCRSNGEQFPSIDKLESLSDLYKMGVQHIIPTIAVNTDKITQDEITENMWSRSFESVLKDDSRFPVYEMQDESCTREYVEKYSPMFFTMDNQILRDFYIKVLGDFSGYKAVKVDLESEVA